MQGNAQALAMERNLAETMQREEGTWTWHDTDPKQVARTLAQQFESIYEMAEEPMPWKKRFTESLARGLGRYFRLRNEAEAAADEPARAKDLLARAQRSLKRSLGLERYVPASALVTKKVDARVEQDFPWLTSFPFQMLSGYLPDLVDQIAMDSPAFESFTSEHMENYLSSLAGIFEAVETVESTRAEPAPDVGTGGEASANGAFSIQGPDWPRLEDVKAAYTAFVLEETQGDKKAAQAILDISRNSLNKYLAFSETDG